MSREIQLAPLFGAFPADGEQAAAFRLNEINPCFAAQHEIVLDFAGVRIVNSSFANALVAPLVERHGEEALKKLRFRNCNPVVQVLLEGAISLGLQRAEEKGKHSSI
jgi:anti-anti-sigma regulatory factor